MSYDTKTMEQLFSAYAFENGRTCKKDAETTKAKIVQEVYRRVKASFDLLELDTEESAKQTYKQFIEH